MSHRDGVVQISPEGSGKLIDNTMSEIILAYIPSTPTQNISANMQAMEY